MGVAHSGGLCTLDTTDACFSITAVIVLCLTEADRHTKLVETDAQRSMFARNFALETQSSDADEPPWCPHKQQSERKKTHNYENSLAKVEHKKQRISEGAQAKSVRGCASHSVHGRRPYR